MNSNFNRLNIKIIKCSKCSRLVSFRNKISKIKSKQNINETYWGKPLPGFGDLNAKIMIVGLAPAAHGGTRTGRVFTGDKSGNFLFKCLHSVKISNRSSSINIKDGLKLKNTYITNILKCVPPEDKPLNNELKNCSNFFVNEIENLRNLKVIITLGKVAFDNYVKFYKRNHKTNKKILFKHGKRYNLLDGKTLIACYHPSPRNVNTKIINLKMMQKVFIKAKKII
jgi:uracil-DNA glycosylase family 4|tara:strand:+ start:31 stop:705 length:675 start_codon:yes stop_codon:yes gene_type:complete